MDKRGKRLGWLGLIGGGIVSVGGNVRSLYLPEYGNGWRTLPEVVPADAGAYVMAVFLPLAALVGVEMVNHWTHLHKALRFGVLGLISFAALASSFVHVVTVFMWYGQHPILAILGTVAVDGIMILSGLALFTRTPDRPEDVRPDTDTDNGADSLPVDTEPDTDNAPDTTALDTDTLYVPDSLDTPAPVDIVDRVPAPRTPRTRTTTDAAWKDLARTLIADGNLTYAEIASTILGTEGYEGTWPTLEAGRKAVSRLR